MMLDYKKYQKKGFTHPPFRSYEQSLLLSISYLYNGYLASKSCTFWIQHPLLPSKSLSVR